MLKISHEQMDDFEGYQLERFIHEALAFLRSVWGEEIDELGEEETDLLIRDTITRAWEWGVGREHHVLRLLNLRMAMGPEFPDSEEDDWALELLENEDMDDDEKIEALESGVEERVSD